MILFSEHTSPRLNYILGYIFTERLGIPFQVTLSWSSFLESDDNKINYSDQTHQDIITIAPEGLLFEPGIRITKPSVIYKDGIPIIFNNTKETSFPFDAFSAIFYFISRYEEYQPFVPDIHDRFPAKESLAFKNIFLNQPVVDHWIILLKNELSKKYPDLIFKEEQFKAIPTVDVDSPWCYRHKGLLRNTGGLFRDLIGFKINWVILRMAVLFRLLPDPWFVFNWVKKTFTENQLQGILFIHVGKYGKYDKSTSSKKPFFKKAIKAIGNDFQIGLHPSYQAADKPLLIKWELAVLGKIVNKPITMSRQHYLKIKIPKYYRTIIDLGITDDFSMGFADRPGFRAGTSRPFFWYDLQNEQATSLYVHPFAAMDRSIHTYEEKTEAAAHLVYNELIQQVRLVNGLFVTLWHNETFNNYFEWKDWKRLFENVMRQTAQVNYD